MSEKEHIGRNIERLRKMKGMKQRTLAALLSISQQAVSKIESSQVVDGQLLEKIAEALELPEAYINGFSEAFLSSANFEAADVVTGNPDFNRVEKLVELYERLLEAERKKNEVLLAALQKINSINKQ